LIEEVAVSFDDITEFHTFPSIEFSILGAAKIYSPNINYDSRPNVYSSSGNSYHMGLITGRPSVVDS
jgi:hypothetical protein